MKFWFISFSLIFLVACEKVIQVPLNEANQQVVIEAILKDRANESVIKVSKSGTVYDNSGFAKITDALVVVTDSDENVFVFDHQEEGVYTNTDFIVVPTKRYDLKVTVGENTFTSSSQTRSKPVIDSVTYANLAGTLGVPIDKVRYLVAFHAVDNASEQNNYLMNIFRNGKKNRGYYLGNDDFINGAYYSAPFFGSSAKPADTVLIEMHSMDKAIYDYWVGLSGNIDDSPFSAAPANPSTNIQGGALGVFGVYVTDTLTVIMPA